MKPAISIIAAIGKNRELGNKGELLWHIPGDLPRFKKLTAGHPVIMGRKTHESIGRILPERTNIIVTRDPGYEIEGGVVVNSIEKAIEEAKKVENEEIFIIGGGQLYEQVLLFAGRLYLTIVDKEAVADTFFPDYSEFNKIIDQEEKEENGFKFRYLILEK